MSQTKQKTSDTFPESEMKEHVQIKRIYANSYDGDGYRILVDRLWPRGLKKENLNIDKWAKNVAPSPALRKWFAHDPEKWNGFREMYEKELRNNPEVEELAKSIRTHQVVTLLYAARHEQYNHAVVLLDFLKKKIEFEYSAQ